MRASFVIPVGPNEPGIAGRARALRRGVESASAGREVEFILVSDSPSGRAAGEMRSLPGEEFSCAFLTSRLGKGGSLRNAVPLTRGDVVVLMDADADLDPRVVWRMADYVAAGGAAMAVARRISRPHGITRMALSAAYNAAARALLRTRGQGPPGRAQGHRGEGRALRRPGDQDGRVRVRRGAHSQGLEDRADSGVPRRVEGGARGEDPGRGSHVVPVRAALTMLADLLVISYITAKGSATRPVRVGDVLDSEGRVLAPEVMNVVEWRHPRAMEVLRAIHYAVSG